MKCKGTGKGRDVHTRQCIPNGVIASAIGQFFLKGLAEMHKRRQADRHRVKPSQHPKKPVLLTSGWGRGRSCPEMSLLA